MYDEVMTYHEQRIPRVLIGMQTALTGLALLFPGDYPLLAYAIAYGGRYLWAGIFAVAGAMMAAEMTWRWGMGLSSLLWAAVAMVYMLKGVISPFFFIGVVLSLGSLVVMVRHDP